MKTRFLLVVLLTVPLSVFAADVNGTWKADFETQRGLQKYTFTLKQDGAKVTGKVNVDTDGEKRETELKDGKIEGESVTFAEPLSIQGNARENWGSVIVPATKRVVNRNFFRK